jgi:hypothetical protein
MSQLFDYNSVFPRLFESDSTKTKQAPSYIPNLGMTEEEREESNSRFFEFISNTQEGESFIQRSSIEHNYNESLGEYYRLQEDWIRSSSGAKPNNIDAVIDSWRIDRSDTPLLSITVAPEGYSFFRPNDLIKTMGSQAVDEFTFSGGSTWGFLLNKEASAPQFTELLGRNAQSNHFAAIRARGGIQGELWQNVVSKNPWLAQMFKEDETVQKELDAWIQSTPTAFNLKGSVPLSAYFGRTILDVLEDAPVPEFTDPKTGKTVKWSAKQAIEEIKTTDPRLANLLFNEMQIDESRLEELGKNPLQFKFFIADAIDQFAFTSFMVQYEKSTGGFKNFVGTMAWPLIRDSFNSNDNFSELIAIGGGLAISGTVVGGVVGVPSAIAGGVSTLLKPITIGRRVFKTYDKFQTIAKLSAKAAQVNKAIWKTKKFLPSNITDTIFDSTGITKKLFTTAKDASRTKKVLTYGVKQFIGEAAQGAVESTVSQIEAMENDFATRFSMSDLAYNMLEEGIGGLALGGPIRFAGRSAESLSTTKAGLFITKKIGQAKANLVSSVTPNLSTKQKSNIRMATSMIMGIPDNVDFDDYQNSIETELRLTALVTRIENSTNLGNILESDVSKDPILSDVIGVMSRQNPEKNFASRVELLRRIDIALSQTTDSVTGKSNLTGDDIEGLLFLTGMHEAGNNEALKTKLIESTWISKQKKLGNTKNKDGKDLSASDMTEQDIEEIATEIDTKIQNFVVKLGAKSSDEVMTVFNTSFSKDDEKLIQSVVEEEKSSLKDGETKSIGIGNLPLDGVVPGKITKEDLDATPTDRTLLTLKDIDSLAEGTELEFVYSSGSRANQKRTVRVLSTYKDSKGELRIKALDLDLMLEREYVVSRIKGDITMTSSPKETKPIESITQETDISKLVNDLLSGKEDTTADENLTEEEINDLRNRTCYRKDNP